MSAEHSTYSDLIDRISEFVVDGEANGLTDANWTEFERLLRDNDDACLAYVEFMGVSVALRQVVDAMPAEDPPGYISFDGDDGRPNMIRPFFCTTDVLQPIRGYFAPSWPMAYLIAVILMASGLGIFANIYISSPDRLAGRSPTRESSDPKTASSLPANDFVGRVTDASDCVLNNSAQDRSTLRTAAVGAPVSLGDRFSIQSGLMEITYETGAKVILQGPVTYDIVSRNGGYLAVGSVTARLETRGTANAEEVRHRDSDTGDFPNPAFSVRTPTAVVTDLGTEFGVVVSKSGATESHVFRGLVRVQTVSAEGTVEGTPRQLRQGEGIRVERKPGNTPGQSDVATFVSPARNTNFVREIAQSKPVCQWRRLADWRFEAGHFLLDSSGNGHTLVNHGAKQMDGTAMFDGKAFLNTVDSIDLRPYERVRISWRQKAVTLSPCQVVWEHSSDFNYTHGAIANIIQEGMGQAGIRNDDMTPGGNETIPKYNVDQYATEANKWETWMVAYDRTAYRASVVRVFKNGREMGTAVYLDGFPPKSFVSAPFFIGSRSGFVYPFSGQIDDMTIEGSLKSYNP